MKTYFSPTLIAVLLCFSAWSGLHAATPSWFESLSANTANDVTIHTDLSALLDQRAGAKDEQAGLLTLTRPDGTSEVWEIDLELRGKFRRRVCDFPPLKLDFSKSQLQARGFADFDKYKLVTHCLEDRTAGEDQLLRELAVYRMYESLTPNSYRTRLLRITYVDAAGKISRQKRYAFILEPTRELSHRLAAEECEDCRNPLPTQLDETVENRMAVFQYLIGNVDYSLPMGRNLKLFRRTDGQLIPVPYDFDFSGMVNANYFLSNPDLGQTSARQRIFIGLSVSDKRMDETIRYFKSKEEELKDILASQDYLSRATRQDMQDYLQSFYDEIDSLHAYTQFRTMVRQAVPTGGEPRHYGRR